MKKLSLVGNSVEGETQDKTSESRDAAETGEPLGIDEKARAWVNKCKFKCRICFIEMKSKRSFSSHLRQRHDINLRSGHYLNAILLSFYNEWGVGKVFFLQTHNQVCVIIVGVLEVLCLAPHNRFCPCNSELLEAM